MQQLEELEFLSNFINKKDLAPLLDDVISKVRCDNNLFSIDAQLAKDKLTNYRCDRWEDYYIVLPKTCNIVTHVDTINKLVSIINQGDLLLCMVGIGPTEDLAWFDAYNKLVKDG